MCNWMLVFPSLIPQTTIIKMLYVIGLPIIKSAVCRDGKWEPPTINLKLSLKVSLLSYTYYLFE